MSELLARMARAIAHHWKRGLVAGIVAVFILGALASSSTSPADDFAVPGTESQTALDLFRDHQKEFAGADSSLVFTAKDGAITDPENRQAVEAALAKVERLPDVETVGDPYEDPDESIGDDGRLATTDVRYSKEWGDLDKEDGEKLKDTVNTVEDSGRVDVEMRGLLIDLAAEQSFPVGELVGVLIAVVLLTLLFRSGAAMGATLFGALLGVIAGQMILAILAKPLGLPDFAKTLAVMLGLGAGIDYSLLIIGRYREQRAAGNTARDAAAKAAATSGATVVAAGLIVVVAIMGLLVVGIPLIGKMGVGVALAVATVVVSSLTMLPVMMGALSKRLKPKRAEHATGSPAFERWGERITAHPWRTIAAGVVILLIFTIPVADMRLGQPDDGNQPETTTQRKAYDQLTAAFGSGSNGPLLLAVDTPKGAASTKQQLDKIRADVERTPGVESVGPAQASDDGEMATIFATPTTSPQDQKTSDLVDKLRDDVLPAATQDTPLKVYVGGNTAGFDDFSRKVSERLPVFIPIVIGLSVLLLIVAFRSLWIPLVSAVFNLLAVGASYGVITAVFQKGWGSSLIGVDSGVPIVSFMPLMMFAILFGLSMDYNVFLVSRIHEAYNEGDRPRASVIHGVGRIGKVILFAGLIMAAVFLAFATAPDTISKMFGIGLGFAILIDVLFIRLLIAPAVVTLLGDRAWHLPGWMDKLLPNISLEGHMVEAIDEPEERLVPPREPEGAVR